MSHRESGLLGGPDQVMNEVTATNTISLGEFSLQIVDALGVVLRYAIWGSEEASPRSDPAVRGLQLLVA